MKTLTLTLVLSLLIAGSALAFDCSTAETLECNGPALSGTIGISPEITFPPCGATTSYKHKIYRLSVTSPQEISVTLTGAASTNVQLVVFENCDENACVAQGLPNSPTLDGVCLPVGDYTIGMSYLIEAVMPYEISLACTPCNPVPVEAPSFGALKSCYR